MTSILALVLAVGTGAAISPARANVMTFTGMPTNFFSGSYTEDGITLTDLNGYMAGSTYYYPGGNPGEYFDTTNYYGAPLRLTLANGGLFDLTSIDLRSFCCGPASETFTGHRANCSTVTITLSAPYVLSWVTGTFGSSWTDLTEVDWGDTDVALDNVVLDPAPPVPEPASLAVLGTALAGFGLLRAQAQRSVIEEACDKGPASTRLFFATTAQPQSDCTALELAHTMA